MRIGVSLVALLCLTAGNLAAQDEKTNVDIKGPTGTLIKGTYHSPGKAGPAILLLHQCNMDRRAWDVLTGDLTKAGFHVLTFDFPGYGETKGNFQADFMPEAEAAYAFLLSQKGVDKNRMAAGGASCGVDVAGDLAVRHAEIRTLMLMSGQVTGPAQSHIAAKPSIAVFGIVAENDPEGASGIKDAVGASKNPRSTLKVYPGSEHGVPLFAVHADLKPALLKWLQTELR